MAESEKELKSLLMKVKEESEKAGLKLTFQKTKIMASITLWQTEGGKVKKVTDFIFLGSKTTVNCYCTREIKRRLLLGRKAVTNLDRVLKSRDITLPTKIRILKAKVSPVVTYRCKFSSVQFRSFAQSCLTLCSPMNCSTPGLPVHHQLPESTKIHLN